MRRNWFIAAIVVGILAIVVAAVLVRLKDDDSSSSKDTAAWASAVCTSLSDWRSSILSIADVSSGGLTKESLREKLDQAQAATEELVGDLEDLGPPDIESGDELKEELDTSVDALEGDFAALRSGAQEALDSDSPTAFLTAIAALAPQFQNLVTTISSTLETLESSDVPEDAKAELQQAFESSEACQALRSES